MVRMACEERTVSESKRREGGNEKKCEREKEGRDGEKEDGKQ